MTNEINKDSSITNSKDDFLEWMTQRNVTYGWDALVAFDRATINTVFQEQYIRHYGGGKRFPVFSTSIPLLQGLTRALSSIEMGPPQVSFADSSIEKEAPVVQVTVPIVSGLETKLTYGINDYVTLESINDINVLQSPTVTGVLNFKDVKQVGTVGMITLDLKDGTYKLNLGQTNWEMTEGGKAFKEQFDLWSDEESQWVVNTIIRNTGPLAVERFNLRSQRKSAVAVRSDAEYGDGAVVAFVRMEGAKMIGSYPSEEDEIRYLVPDDQGDRYSATILIHDARLLYALIKNVFMGPDYVGSATLERAPFEYHLITENERNKLVVDTASLNLRLGKGFYETAPTPNTRASCRDTRTPVGAGQSKLSFEIEQPNASNNHKTGVLMRIELVDAEVELTTYKVPNNVDLVETKVQMSGSMIARYQLNFNNAGQSISLTRLSETISNISIKPYQFQSSTNTWAELQPHLHAVAEVFFRYLADLNDRATDITTFPLTNLLFGRPYTTVLAEATLVQDSVMFGHIAPNKLEFTLSTPQPVLLQGSVHQFALSNPDVNVTWRLSNIHGETSHLGSINGSGRYVAPSAAAISGSQLRVVVTATAGQTTASALVTVVKKSMELSPRMASVKVGPEGFIKPTAKGLLGITPVWGSVPAGRGQLEAVPGEPDARYYRPVGAPTQGVIVDVVPITVTAGGVTETSHVVVMHQDNAALKPIAKNFTSRTVELDIPIPSASASASASASGGSSSSSSDSEVEWKVVAGSATIDSRGVLTADADPAVPFVVVTAVADVTNPWIVIWGYVVLSLPLAPFPPEPSPGASRLTVSLD